LLREAYAAAEERLLDFEYFHGALGERTVLDLPDGRHIEKSAEIRTFHIAGQRMPGFEVDGVRYRVGERPRFFPSSNLGGSDDPPLRTIRLAEIDPTN
jgi:hypothetical protein